MSTLPLSTRDIPPHQDAVKLESSVRPDGLPDGVHTGGVWEWQGEIWKPLDGRPYMNADCVVPTREAEFLEAMADLPSFPKNWRVQEANGRRWLVRPPVIVLEPKHYVHLDKGIVLRVEQDIMEANRRGWEINDALLLAFDKSTYTYFILDCSSAQEMKGKGAFAANEFDRIMKLFKLCNLEPLAKLRQNARHLLSPLEFEYKHPEAADLNLRHVYASFSRPMSSSWARFDQPVIFEHQKRDEGVPHTWIVTEEPLPEDKLYDYELTWAFSRLR